MQFSNAQHWTQITALSFQVFNQWYAHTWKQVAPQVFRTKKSVLFPTELFQRLPNTVWKKKQLWWTPLSQLCIFRVSFLFPGAYFNSCFVAVFLLLLNWVEICHNRKPGKKETKNACFKTQLRASSALLEKYSSPKNSMINNRKWYSKAISCRTIKDFSHGKSIATMHHARCSLFVTEHTTENKPILSGEKKRDENKGERINQLSEIHLFWCSKRKTELSMSHKNRVMCLIPTVVIILKHKRSSLLCILSGLDWSFFFLRSALFSSPVSSSDWFVPLKTHEKLCPSFDCFYYFVLLW